MECRPGCAACCIAPSISSALPGLPSGKPADLACPHLTPELRCALFGTAQRPACCAGLQPAPDMCGADRSHALRWLQRLERATRPD
jgi:hypothetical protein